MCKKEENIQGVKILISQGGKFKIIPTYLTINYLIKIQNIQITGYLQSICLENNCQII